MKQYIILLIILLLIIIFYFTYKNNKKNIEQYSEAEQNAEAVVNYLNQNNFIISDFAELKFKNDQKEINININNSDNIINIGDDYILDKNTNTFKCGKYNLDNNKGIIYNTENGINIDISDNLYFKDFIYDKNKNLIKKDNSFKIDSIGNINIGEYIYDINGNLIKKDNSLKVDPSGNLDFDEYIYDINGSLIKKNNSFKLDSEGNFVFGNYFYNKDGTIIKNDNSFKIDSKWNLDLKDFYYVKNGDLFKKDNSFNIDPSGNVDFGEYYYNKKGKLNKKDNSLILDYNGDLDLGNYNYKNGDLIKKDNSFKIDNTGNIDFGQYMFNKNKDLIKKDNSIKVDNLGNIDFGQYFSNINGDLIKKDNSFKIDSEDNIDIRNYLYSATGNLIKKDKSIRIDPSGNLNNNSYSVNIINNSFNKLDNSISLDNSGKLQCRNVFELDPNTGNKVIVGTNNYFVNNNRLTDPDNTFSIESNNIINLNSNKYSYNIPLHDISGNPNLPGNFHVRNTGTFHFGKNNSGVYNYDGLGSTIYSVSKIVLEKPASENTSMYPLHISSIRFYEFNNRVITPDKYTVTLNNIVDGQYDLNGTTELLKYYDPTKNQSSSYGGPKVNSYSLYWNKTLRFGSVGEREIGGFIFNSSFDFIGYGLNNAPYISGTLPSTLQSLTQSYTFTFNTPVYIKYVEVENIKKYSTDIYGKSSFSRIVGSYLDTYININGESKLKNRIPCILGTSLPTTGQYYASPPVMTDAQSAGRVERFAAVNYNTTAIPTGPTNQIDPIVRYYLQ